MNKTMAIVKTTLMEGFSKFTIIALFIFSTLFLLIFLFGVNIRVVGLAVTGIRIFGFVIERAMDLSVQGVLNSILSVAAVVVYNMVLLISVFATADFIPSMLRQGQVELFLSKPLSRTHLLLAKYLGTILIVALNICYLFLFLYFILYLKLGLWNGYFLLAGLFIIGMFAVYAALMMFLSIQTGNALVSVIAAFALILFEPILSGILQAGPRILGRGTFDTLNLLKWLLPNNYYANKSIVELIGQGRMNDLGEMVSTLLFGLCFLLFSIWSFNRKDY